ncbi:MAG TPA: hypothetical protein PLD10_15970 [Rhodopila sp.]|nr:hypothetical protein [Rhodopila sp.]
MRASFVQCTSATGGASDLTLTAAHGALPFFSAFGVKRWVEYSIIEYTDSTRATILRSERGYAQADPTAKTLLRSAAQVVETWDGTTYNNTSATPLSFGTTAANIDIVCGPTAGTARPTIPFVASNGAHAWISPANLRATGSTTSSFNASATIWFAAIEWTGDFSIQSYTWQFSSAASGSNMLTGIYEVAKSGLPGEMVANLTRYTTLNTAITTQQIKVAGADFDAFYLPPGWYYLAMLHDSTAAAWPAWSTLGVNSRAAPPGMLPTPTGYTVSGLTASSAYASGLPADAQAAGLTLAQSVNVTLPAFFGMGPS